MSLRGASELSRISFLVAACSATLAKLRATALYFIAASELGGVWAVVRWFDGRRHLIMIRLSGSARLRLTAPSHERAARSHRDEVRRTPLTALLRVLLVLADDHSMSTLTVLSS